MPYLPQEGQNNSTDDLEICRASIPAMVEWRGYFPLVSEVRASSQFQWAKVLLPGAWEARLPPRAAGMGMLPPQWDQ